MRSLLLILLLSSSNALAQEAAGAHDDSLPLAPQRDDGLDQLPKPIFQSASGVDPKEGLGETSPQASASTGKAPVHPVASHSATDQTSHQSKVAQKQSSRLKSKGKEVVSRNVAKAHKVADKKPARSKDSQRVVKNGSMQKTARKPASSNSQSNSHMPKKKKSR